MPQFSTKRRVDHAPPTCSTLVADVERYPEFVPHVQRHAGAQPHRQGARALWCVVAAMTVAYKMIHQTFTSRATLDRPNLKILVEYLDGPFRHMQNRWAFRATGEHACEVEFYIDYEFRSRALSLMMGRCSTPSSAASPAFEQRADRVYGRTAPLPAGGRRCRAVSMHWRRRARLWQHGRGVEAVGLDLQRADQGRHRHRIGAISAVPGIGANHSSMSRRPATYLTSGLSGR